MQNDEIQTMEWELKLLIESLSISYSYLFVAIFALALDLRLNSLWFFPIVTIIIISGEIILY